MIATPKPTDMPEPTSSAPGTIAWNADLVAIAHPSHLSLILHPDLAPALKARLQSCRRLQARLATLLSQASVPMPHGIPAGLAADTEAGKSIDADRLLRIDLLEAVRLAGAAWHSKALRKLIRGNDIADVVAQIGARAHGFGVRQNLDSDALPIAEPAALAKAILDDGWHCLACWLAQSPAPVRVRIFVRLPQGTAIPDPAFTGARRARALALAAPVIAELETSSDAAA